MKRNRREFIKTSALGVAGITLSGMGLSAASYNRCQKIMVSGI